MDRKAVCCSNIVQEIYATYYVYNIHTRLFFNEYIRVYY